MLKYTLCFIQRGQDLLMLNRRYAPTMGLWNGVGGKIEPGETPAECILREIQEETGIAVTTVRYGGSVTWTVDGVPGGLYTFIAEVPADLEYPTPRAIDEGLLDWKPTSWVTDPENFGVVPNIPRFLPPMLRGERPLHHHFDFVDGLHLVRYTTSPDTEA